MNRAQILTIIMNQLKKSPMSHIPLGRWKIDNCSIKTSKKIDLANEDHCGPCGEYKNNKLSNNIKRIS